MSSGAESLNIFEIPFYYLQLNTPAKRFLGSAILVGGALHVFRPSSLFMESGTPRSWYWTTPESDRASATYVPWWTIALAAGIVTSTFI